MRLIEILGCIVVLVALFGCIWVAATIFEFLVEVPKQLKRIADALERR